MSKITPHLKKKNKERWGPALEPRTLSPIPDLEVSNFGKVRRRARKRFIKSGHERSYREVESEGTLLQTGYVRAFGYSVHQLVYCSFINENVEPGFVIHHKDNNRENNKLSNLEKISYKLNNQAKRRKTSVTSGNSRKWKGQVHRNRIKGEKWRVIAGFPKYEISDLGRVFSLHFGGSLMSLTPSQGYETVKISKGKRQYESFQVHRLVYENFMGKIPDECVINHIDHDKTNNRLSNLECVTRSENTKAAVKAGVLKPGNKTVAQREQLKNAILKGVSVDQIVKKSGFSRSHVNKIRRELGVSNSRFNNKQQMDSAISLYKHGLSYQEISVRTGLKEEYLPKLMHKKGLSISRAISIETKKKILSDLKNLPQVSMKKISELHNVSKTTVQQLNKDHGIRNRKASENN